MSEGIRRTTTAQLDFKGYYLEKQIEGIAKVDGVYVADACTLQAGADGIERSSVIHR